MHLYMCVGTSVYVRTYNCLCMRLCMRVHPYISVYMGMYVIVCVSVCLGQCIWVHISVRIWVRICVHIWVRIWIHKSNTHTSDDSCSRWTCLCLRRMSPIGIPLNLLILNINNTLNYHIATTTHARCCSPSTTQSPDPPGRRYLRYSQTKCWTQSPAVQSESPYSWWEREGRALFRM